MRALIQRVTGATVTINSAVFSQITSGLVILLGIEMEDGLDDVSWLCGKIARLRVFDDEAGVMNLPVTEVAGELLVVSQFTLHASTKKGNRPSYIRAAPPEHAIPLYEAFVDELKKVSGCTVVTGEFGAMMQVALVNDGPVTIFIDSKNKE